MVSVGDAEALGTFLRLNPEIKEDEIFVDDSSDFALYKAAGFGRLDEAKPSKEDAKMRPPGFSMGDWWKYLSNVAELAPIKKGEKLTGVPEGVLRLGGTFVLDGDDVVYAWADAAPGAHPDVDDVLETVGV